MSWSSIAADGGAPEAGSEGGIVVLDEEHDHGARITLERDAGAAPFAITCGIHGWMMHTRFFRRDDEARQAFEDMKRDLDSILEKIPMNSDPLKDEKMAAVTLAISSFVDRYPT